MFVKVILVIVVVCVALAQAHVHDLRKLDDYNFDRYNADYRLGLKKGTSEYVKREAFFNIELARVKSHNSMNKSWKETINKFSHMSKGEKRAFHGRSKGKHAAHLLSAEKSKEIPYDETKDLPIEKLPGAIDWRTKGIVSAVKDQGHCGSCWAFASTAVLESSLAKNSGLLFDLSPNQIAMCAPNPDKCGGTGGCYGSTAELAFDYVAKSGGLMEEFQYPYTAYYGNDSACAVPDGTAPKLTIEGYTRVPTNSYKSFMNSLVKEGPIAISVDASNWHAYHSGVYSNCNQENPDLDHAVVAVGYGEDANGSKYFLVRNSWSASWGEAGYIKLSREDGQELQCGIDNTPQDGVACEGDTTPEKVCGTCGILYDNAYPVGADVVA
jgi:cathepsin L